MERFCNKPNLGCWDLKLSDNPSVQVRTQRDICTFVGVLEINSKEKTFLCTAEKSDFKTGVFFCARYRPVRKLRLRWRLAPQRILTVNKASDVWQRWLSKGSVFSELQDAGRKLSSIKLTLASQRKLNRQQLYNISPALCIAIQCT